MSSVRRVQSNLLQQNVYVRDCCLVHDVADPLTTSSYPELKRKEFDNGFSEVVEDIEYPITQDYVNSFADSCDYKLDPVSAISKGRSGSGLGDIRDMQAAFAGDSSSIAAYVAKLRSSASASKSATVDVSSASVEEENK